MDSICLLFNCPRNWESNKQLLGQPNFYQELEFFDRTKMSDDLYNQLGKIVKRKDFRPETVQRVSRACGSLCSWVHSVYQYASLQRHMAPQVARKEQLGLRMAESRGRLRVARLQEEEVRSRLEDLEKQQQLVRQEQDDLKTQLCKAKTLETEAVAAVKQVSRHIDQWESTAQDTEMTSQTITGDALILAAIITYLGPFWPDIRVELMRKWKQLCDTGRISVYPEDPRASLDTNSAPTQHNSPPVHIPIPIGADLRTALARAVGMDPRWVDGVPPRLVLKLLLWGFSGLWAQHWPLLADAQQHAEISTRPTQLTGKNTVSQREGEYGMVVSADDSELMHKLSKASGKGLRVLLTHVERVIPTPQLLAMLVRPAGSRCPGFRRPVPVAHPNFRLFLSSPLPVRLLLKEVHPSILAEVRVIDLSLSAVDVQELMLTELVQSECPELWNQHCLVKADKQSLQDKLCQEEGSLMEYILQSITPLLQDPEFLSRVSACQTASHSLQAEIQGLMLELERHKPLLADFQRVAQLATSLYQALQEVERLSPIYFFPLRNFRFAVRGALAMKGRTDMSCTGDVVTGAVMAEITHRMISHLLTQYRPCLFESHATLLRLLVAVALFCHNEPCSELERVAFLKGLGDVGSPVCAVKHGSPPPPSSPTQTSQHVLPSWVPLQIQGEVFRLEKIPAFKGLITSLNTSPRQWQEYLRFPSSTLVGPVPCRSHSHLSTLQRALLWKTMLPHWLAIVADDMGACHLGQPLRSAVVEAPHTGSPEALSRFLCKRDGPVIITMPDLGREAWTSIQPLRLIQQVAKYQADMKGVHVKIISFGEIFHKEIIMSALDNATKEGHWLVFNNCHLLKEWNKEVLNKINQLLSGSKGYHTDVESEEGLIPVASSSPSSLGHPRFKMWFITRGYTPHSIPAVVRVSALRLVCDSPWDMKEELLSSLRQVVSVAQSESTAGITASNMAPILRCAILHSVLLQRQTYKYLGQGEIYYWTQEDLLALVDAQLKMVKYCEDQTEALEYLAATVIYGGHVADAADLEAVECVAKACLRPSPPHWGSGPHTLSDIFHIPGHFCNEPGLLPNLEHRVQTLPNTNNPLVLGFSAGLTEELVKVKSHTLNILLCNSQETIGLVRSLGSLQSYTAVLPELNQARDRLQTLRDSLGRKEDSRILSVGTVSLGPLRNFLQTEWDGLVDMVSSLLSDQANQNCKQNNSSLLTLSNLSRLERRAELLRAYLWNEDPNGSPGSYQLSAFDNARGFLAAIMREAAQAKQRDISNVSLCFQVLSVGTSPVSFPLSGVYLSGLELRGALWDTRLGALQDTLSPKPCLLPVLWVRARIGSTGTSRNIDSPPFNASHLPIYNCPLYLDHVGHENGDWGLAEANIITRVPLVAKLDPVLCTLRRVRLVSTL
ncbi:dynein heavy chain domain-containing protein 1 [Aplochiton taeniatus]